MGKTKILKEGWGTCIISRSSQNHAEYPRNLVHSATILTFAASNIQKF